MHSNRPNNFRPAEWLKGQLRADNNESWMVRNHGETIEINTQGPQGNLCVYLNIHKKRHGSFLTGIVEYSGVIDHAGQKFNLRNDEAEDVARYLNIIRDRNLPAIETKLDNAVSRLDVGALAVSQRWKVLPNNNPPIFSADLGGLWYTLSAKELYISGLAGAEYISRKVVNKRIPQLHDDVKVLLRI